MRIKVLTPQDKLNNSLFLDFDLIILSSKSDKDLSYERHKIRKSVEYIINTFPELKDHIIPESRVMFGLDFANKILKTLNSQYSFKLVEKYKVTSEEYSLMASEGFIPLSTSFVESWSHDFYLHGMGMADVPANFTNWYKENYEKLSEEDRTVMASVIEFSSIKHIAGKSVKELCKPNRWGELYSFFYEVKINSNQISNIFKKHNAERFFAETLGDEYAQG